MVERLPVLGEKITVKTWPYNFKGFYGYRNFTIEDVEGKICAYADSQWIFMDLKRERPARISDKMLEEYQMEEPFKMDYADRKIKLPEKMQEMCIRDSGYSDEWVEEAERRGLPNIKSMVDAIPALNTEKAVSLFERFGVFTKAELDSRVEIEYETYAKEINIEAKAMIDIAGKQIIPAVRCV